MSEYKHLHPSAAEYINASQDDRIQWLKNPRWIGYPRAHEILGKLEDMLRHPRDSRMPSMLLIGPTNNGKTRLVKHFAKKHPTQENPHGDHIIAPVLYMQSLPTPNEDGFYANILSMLFERIPASSTNAKRERVIQVLRDIQLRILIIDELHNLLAGSSTKQQQFLNMIKYLSNELEISIVGCGTGDLLRAVATDEQIQNRFVPEILPTWKMDKSFKQLLSSFEYVLPLRKPSLLHEPTLASKIMAMSEGTIGEMSMLLNTAAIYAIQHGDEKITTDALNACGYISPSDRTKYAARIK